ncbi:acyl-CoA dehydrogenase family protein [Thalassorhabdomicrobium marinisediminis]|uniref:acyl-CoA dehydrogenase family protein n=1 Tax=Thalassorhabdomicrobium marinisediminis TaxID=2170577 RepID=UPI00248F87E7|nr:acyl-CoA dehydrogenase family protein [Thalassorhabdomicrobium marinisediminis]
MEFHFTEEQDMTADVVRNLLADLCTPADLRRLMASGAARDDVRWQSIVEMGLAGAMVSEDHGGLGLSSADFIRVAEVCGYAALPEPLVENTAVALPLLADAAPDAPALSRALDGEITVAVGHPANPFVADADTAGAILMPRDGALYLVDPASASLVEQPSIDPFRRLSGVDFAPEEARLLTVQAQPLLDRALDRGALFVAAQLVGIAQACVDMAVAYAKERKQFGKPIGSYQAVKHQLASAQVKIEFARPVVYAAAAALPQHDDFSRARVSHAKLAAGAAADLAARTAIQVHGAMGYSWEVDVHFFLKRAIALENTWGTPAFHRARVAHRVLTQPLGPEHTFAREHSDV